MAVIGGSFRRVRVVAALLMLCGVVVPVASVITAPPAAAAPDVAVVSSMRNIRPDQAVPAGTPSASVTAARNEFESFQIAISGGGQTLTNVNVAVTSPIGNLPTQNVTIYREEYFDAVAASDDEGGTGRWGDALIPEIDPIYHENRTAFPIPSIPSNENRVAWVDLLVPADHAVGQFTGTITVTADGGFVRTVPVSLTVLNFTLPSTPSLDSAFFMYLNGPCLQLTGNLGCNGDTELQWKLSTLYSRVALENRMTIANSSPLGGSNAPPATGPNQDRFARYLLPLIDGTSPQPPAGHTQWSPIRLAGAQLTTLGLYGYVDYGCLQACAARWKQEATAHGFADRVFNYACDEPHYNAPKWDGCDTYNAQAKAGWPELPWEVTGSLAETNWRYGVATNPVKLHVPSVTFLDDASRAAYDTWLGTPGNKLWLYSGCDSFGCDGAGETNPLFHGKPGYAVDAPAIQSRASSLLAFKYRVSGELYYDTLRWGCDDLYNGCGGTATFGANGDGVMYYPGLACTTPGDKRCIGGTNPIPIESVRMKRYRDGSEDYEYLKFLEDNGRGTQARAILDAYLPDAHSALPAKDATFDAMRAQLIALVEEVVGTPPVRPGFHPMSPTRVLDSRDGTGGLSGAWGAGQSRTLDLGAAVPAEATAVVLNVTATGVSAASHLTVWPAGQGRPVASNLNMVPGQTVPNLVVVKLGTNDDISIFNNSGNVDVIADVAGWFDDGTVPDGTLFTGATPTRVLDSRDGTGGLSGAWGAGQSRTLDLGAAVPAEATAVVLNVTATGVSAASHLTVWPAGQGRPVASNLNMVPGQTVPNLVVVKLGTNDDISIFNNSGNSDVIADVVGWYRPGVGGGFNGMTPTRLVDSRDGTGGISGPWTAGQSRSVTVTNVAGVPADATGVVLNVTVTGPSAPSHLTVYPSGLPVPLASNLNMVPGQTVPNLVMVKVGTGGKISVFNNEGTTHVIVDIVGWYR